MFRLIKPTIRVRVCVWTRGKQEAISVGAICGCESQITSARLMSGGWGCVVVVVMVGGRGVVWRAFG